MKEKNPDATLSMSLERYHPDIVGLSLRNLDNQNYLETLDFVPAYSRWVAMVNKMAPTIIGGSAVMTIPEEMFTRVGATYAMVGQDDRTIINFLEEFESGRKTFETPGLMWRENGIIHHNPGLFNGYPDRGTIDWAAMDYKRYRSSYMSCTVIT